MVENETSSVEYELSTSTGPFAIPFYFLENGHIVAELYTLSSGEYVQTVLTLDTDYTLSGAGDEDGGTLTLTVAHSGSTLLIYRDPEATQMTSYVDTGKFPATSHERALDKLTMLIQKLSWWWDTLALKKPNVFSSYYDARQNRIANVADPDADQDAVNKRYVTGQVADFTAYVDNKVFNESVARQAADITLQQNINAEVLARQKADANIQDQLTGNIPLESSAFSVISWHKKTIDNSITIPDNMNAWSFGPEITISDGQSVTIPENSFWTIANGQQVTQSGANVDYGEL